MDWENDHAACRYFTKHGFSCLSDCADDALMMSGGVTVPNFAKQCFWLTLGCDDLAYSQNPLAEGDSSCPEICEHRDCLRTYEQLIGHKRHLDLHRRCGTNC